MVCTTCEKKLTKVQCDMLLGLASPQMYLPKGLVAQVCGGIHRLVHALRAAVKLQA